jgi:tetratricopeptide (TPR) repeat protein
MSGDDRVLGAAAPRRYGRPRFERPGYERREVGRPSRDEGRTEERPARGPELGDDIRARDLDAEVRAELSSLARPVAETVARRLVAVGRLIDEDPIAALAHAVEARRLASRIGVVREAVGLAAYHTGEWQLAIAELRAYHRMTGRQTHLAVLADCERALGRPERAIDMFRTADRGQLDEAEAVELLVVAAGARGDLGQHDAAVAMLQVRELASQPEAAWAARLRYAYADALLAAGRREEAREWFARAAEVDDELTTDAVERLLDLDGVVLDDPAYEETTDEDTADEDAADDEITDEQAAEDQDAADDETTDEEAAEDEDAADDEGTDEDLERRA